MKNRVAFVKRWLFVLFFRTRLKETVSQGERHCFQPAMDAELSDEVVDVISRRSRADEELLSNSAGRGPGGEEAKHFSLSSAEIKRAGQADGRAGSFRQRELLHAGEKLLDKMLQLFLLADIAEKVDENAKIFPLRRDQNGTDTYPDVSPSSGADQEIASGHPLLAKRPHQIETSSTADDTPRVIAAPDHVIAVSAQGLLGLEAKELLGRVVPENNFLIAINGQNAIRCP